MQAFALFVLFVFLAYSFWGSRRAFAGAGKSVLLWTLILFVLIVGYAFRFEFTNFKNKVFAVLLPSYSWQEEGKITIARNINGHFYINAEGNNHTIRFMVDTGASDIALTKQDAKKLGIKLNNLKYNKPYSTANGVTFSAPVIIKELKIGKKTFYNLKGHVSKGGLGTSLLGMSIIDDFRSFAISEDMLILEY